MIMGRCWDVVEIEVVLNTSLNNLLCSGLLFVSI